MRRKQLGAELRRLRHEASVSVESIAELLDCSIAKVGHFENGRNGIRKSDLAVLLNYLGVSADRQAVLEELRKASTERGWWATFRLPTWLQTYVGLESDATSIRVFELELVTALLQTKAYARRTQEIADHTVSREDVDRFADARIRRQSVLTGPDPVQLSVILSEAVLARTAVEPEIGADQVRHLIEAAGRPNISIRILPWSAGMHPAMSGSFHVLDFDPDASLPVAYQEHAVGGHLIDDPEVVGSLTRLFETLAGRALTQADSLALLEEYANGSKRAGS